MINQPQFDQTFADELVCAWEEVYKRGLSTFWMLAAASDGHLTAEGLQEHIKTLSNSSFELVGQSYYRALRRLFDTGLLDMRRGQQDKRVKEYSLSPLGHAVLQEFTRRNIVYFTDDITNQKIKEILSWDLVNPSLSAASSLSVSPSRA